MAALPGVIERSFQDGENSISRRPALANTVGAPVRPPVVLFLSRLGAGTGGFLGKPLVPLLDLLSRQPGDRDGTEEGQDMRLSGLPRIVHGLSPAPLVGLQIGGHRVSDRVWAI